MQDRSDLGCHLDVFQLHNLTRLIRLGYGVIAARRRGERKGKKGGGGVKGKEESPVECRIEPTNT